MRHQFFDATVYSTQPEARVGITFKPTPYLSVYELNSIIDGLIWVLGAMGGPIAVNAEITPEGGVVLEWVRNPKRVHKEPTT